MTTDGKIVMKIDKDLEDIMPTFLENRKKDLVKLDAALESTDYKAIEVIAHKLAGNAGSYGLPDLGDIGAELERAAGTGNSADVNKLITQYNAYMHNLEIEYV